MKCKHHFYRMNAIAMLLSRVEYFNSTTSKKKKKIDGRIGVLLISEKNVFNLNYAFFFCQSKSIVFFLLINRNLTDILIIRIIAQELTNVLETVNLTKFANINAIKN